MDNDLRTSSCPQIVFVRFTQKRDQCIHKTSCVRIQSEKLVCENPSNALACIPLTPIMQRHFWRISPWKCCQTLTRTIFVITVKNRTDIVFDMLPSWSIYIDVYKMCKNWIKNTNTKLFQSSIHLHDFQLEASLYYPLPNPIWDCQIWDWNLRLSITSLLGSSTHVSKGTWPITSPLADSERLGLEVLLYD